MEKLGCLKVRRETGETVEVLTKTRSDNVCMCNSDMTLDEIITYIQTDINSIESDVSALGIAISALQKEVDAEIARIDKKINDEIAKIDKKIDDEIAQIDEKINTETARLDERADDLASDISDLMGEVSKVQNISAGAIIQTASGESIVVRDSSDDPLRGLRVFGKTEQVTTTGAQLFEFKSDYVDTRRGLQINVNEDGSLTVNGIPDDAYVSCYNGRIYLEPGTYFVSGGENKAGCVYAQIAQLYDDGTAKYIRNNSFVVDGTESAIRFNIQAGLTLDEVKNYTIYPMLNKGSTPLPYEPYTGGIPSPSPQYPQELVSAGDDGDVEVGVYGGNLFDKNNARYVRGIACESQTLHFYYNGLQHVRMYYMDAKPNTSYFISKIVGSNFRVCTCPEVPTDGGVITCVNANTSENSCVITTGNEDKYIAFYLLWTAEIDSGITYESVIDTLMVAKGNTYVPFEPYKAKQSLTALTPNGLPGIKVTDASLATYTDADGQMWCADEIDFERGVYVKMIGKVVIDGSSNIIKQTSIDDNRYDYKVSLDNLKNTPFTSVVSDKLNGVANRNLVMSFGDDGITTGFVSDPLQCLFFNVSTHCPSNSVSGVKEYLTVNPITAYYILATPIETPLSEEELTAYRALHSNYPVTTILNDSGANMEVKYNADTKIYIDNKFAELKTALVALGGI